VALLLKNGHVIDPVAGVDAICDVLIRDGVIVEVGTDLTMPKGETVDCTQKVIVPGLIDAHTHLREPGREDEETVASGTRAAAHGGFTAVCAMPNTSPICDTASAVRFLEQRAAEQGVVRVHPIGAVTLGQGGETLAEIGDMTAAGAVAFSDDGHAVPTAAMMRNAMDYIKAFDRTLISHAEDTSLSGDGVVNEGAASTMMGLPGWPAAAEEIAVARDIRLAELTGCRLHLAHLSTAGSVALLRDAKRRGLAVTGEVTPHHLFLDETALLGYDTNLKMNPPLRTARDREALVEAVCDGTVDCIATDHAPHARHEKDLEFEVAPFGTVGLETALSLVITHLLRTELVTWADVVQLMAHAPRAAFGLAPVSLAAGYVGDITIIDPEAKVEVTEDWLVGMSHNSAFLGQRLLGKASDVLVGGYFALRNGKVVQ